MADDVVEWVMVLAIILTGLWLFGYFREWLVSVATSKRT
jgi:hypothetical protein